MNRKLIKGFLITNAVMVVALIVLLLAVPSIAKYTLAIVIVVGAVEAFVFSFKGKAKRR